MPVIGKFQNLNKELGIPDEDVAYEAKWRAVKALKDLIVEIKSAIGKANWLEAAILKPLLLDANSTLERWQVLYEAQAEELDRHYYSA